MRKTEQQVEFELTHEPEHYNRNCGCMIPAAWVAILYLDGELQPKWPCGDTREEAIANVLRQWPNANEIQPEVST